jgi:ABC-type transporter Mla subunit MlaD
LSPQTTTTTRLRRAAAWAGLRLRARDAVARTFAWLPLPLVYAVVALTAVKVAKLGPDAQAWLIYGGLVPVFALVAAVAQAWLKRRPAFLGALALDRHHGLKDRITNTLSFASRPEAERSAMMQAAIAEALRSVGRVSPARAAPFRFPPELPIVVFLAGGLVAISLLEVRTHRPIPPPPAVQPLVLSPDDVELFQELADELAEKSEDPESQAAVRRFNQLLEDIADRRLDRREVFKRLEELERELVDGAESDQDALDDGLKSLAKELEKSDLSQPIAKAFEEKKLEDAEQALKKLAERLRNQGDPPSKADLERLRKALEQASQQSEQREQRLAEERQRLEKDRKRLLDKKKKDGKLSKRDQQKLEKNERELKRLDRKSKKARQTRQRMSKLDRELAEAARQLMQEMGKSAESLDSAAEDVNRMARQEMSRQEKEELLRRLREMRELMRQQGKGGREQMERLMEFSRKARGQRDGQGQSGQGKPGKVTLRPGSGEGQIPMPSGGSGKDGQGLLDKGQGQGQGQGPGQEGAQPGGADRGGLEAGVGHDPNLAGDSSELKGATQDVSAVAVDTGEGEASSEVIMGAAERGFTGRGYRKVYVDYSQVAEDVVNQDEIPPGYRFYVRRYFQLIRPRD